MLVTLGDRKLAALPITVEDFFRQLISDPQLTIGEKRSLVKFNLQQADNF